MSLGEMTVSLGRFRDRRREKRGRCFWPGWLKPVRAVFGSVRWAATEPARSALAVSRAIRA
jgi:hypothetical protein